MQVHGNHRKWSVDSEMDLDTAIAWRDQRGGAVFWVAHEPQYPCMAIRVSGDVADVHYFPEAGHPGFRCLGGTGLPEDGFTTLIYEGCDPAAGEATPNRFIVPWPTARSIAGDFLAGGRMSDRVRWFEL